MRTHPIVIEFAGIPYSKKTTTANHLSKMLSERHIPCILIEEYLGSPDFYEAAKMTADVPFSRMLNCAKEIMLNSYDPTALVVLIDRGIFDTYCWFKWFESDNKLPESMLKLAAIMLQACQNYTTKYKVVWLDTEPLIAISRHNHQGRIVNLSNLSKLQASYAKAVEDLSPEISVTRIDSNKVRSIEIAESLGHKLKLWS